MNYASSATVMPFGGDQVAPLMSKSSSGELNTLANFRQKVLAHQYSIRLAIQYKRVKKNKNDDRVLKRVSMEDMTDVQSEAFRMVAEGVVVDQIDPSKRQHVSYEKQGDLGWYSEENLILRKQLYSNKALVEKTRELWNIDNLQQVQKGIVVYKEYEAFMLRLHKLLMKMFDIKEAKISIKQDWDRDTINSDHLKFELFYRSIFELIDVWCNSLKVEDYLFLLQHLIDGITKEVNKKTVLKTLKETKFIDISDEMNREASSQKLLKKKDEKSPPSVVKEINAENNLDDVESVSQRKNTKSKIVVDDSAKPSASLPRKANHDEPIKKNVSTAKIETFVPKEVKPPVINQAKGNERQTLVLEKKITAIETNVVEENGMTQLEGNSGSNILVEHVRKESNTVLMEIDAKKEDSETLIETSLPVMDMNSVDQNPSKIEEKISTSNETLNNKENSTSHYSTALAFNADIVDSENESEIGTDNLKTAAFEVGEHPNFETKKRSKEIREIEGHSDVPTHATEPEKAVDLVNSSASQLPNNKRKDLASADGSIRRSVLKDAPQSIKIRSFPSNTNSFSKPQSTRYSRIYTTESKQIHSNQFQLDNSFGLTNFLSGDPNPVISPRSLEVLPMFNINAESKKINSYDPIKVENYASRLNERNGSNSNSIQLSRAIASNINSIRSSQSHQQPRKLLKYEKEADSIPMAFRIQKPHMDISRSSTSKNSRMNATRYKNYMNSNVENLASLTLAPPTADDNAKMKKTPVTINRLSKNKLDSNSFEEPMVLSTKLSPRNVHVDNSKQHNGVLMSLKTGGTVERWKNTPRDPISLAVGMTSKDDRKGVNSKGITDGIGKPWVNIPPDPISLAVGMAGNDVRKGVNSNRISQKKVGIGKQWVNTPPDPISLAVGMAGNDDRKGINSKGISLKKGGIGKQWKKASPDSNSLSLGKKLDDRKGLTNAEQVRHGEGLSRTNYLKGCRGKNGKSRQVPQKGFSSMKLEICSFNKQR